jgi:hypothetical protein
MDNGIGIGDTDFFKCAFMSIDARAVISYTLLNGQNPFRWVLMGTQNFFCSYCANNMVVINISGILNTCEVVQQCGNNHYFFISPVLLR